MFICRKGCYDDHFYHFFMRFGHHRGYDDHFQGFTVSFGYHRLKNTLFRQSERGNFPPLFLSA
jgi:hypothetical protein